VCEAPSFYKRRVEGKTLMPPQNGEGWRKNAKKEEGNNYSIQEGPYSSPGERRKERTQTSLRDGSRKRVLTKKKKILRTEETK